MTGISGNMTIGAKSIVMSGGYELVDEGERFIYTGGVRAQPRVRGTPPASPSFHTAGVARRSALTEMGWGLRAGSLQGCAHRPLTRKDEGRRRQAPCRVEQLAR